MNGESGRMNMTDTSQELPPALAGWEQKPTIAPNGTRNPAENTEEFLRKVVGDNCGSHAISGSER